MNNLMSDGVLNVYRIDNRLDLCTRGRVCTAYSVDLGGELSPWRISKYWITCLQLI